MAEKIMTEGVEVLLEQKTNMQKANEISRFYAYAQAVLQKKNVKGK